MDAFRRIFLVAGLAAVLTGLLLTLAHGLGTVPLILQAEVYEDAAAASAPAGHRHDHAAGAVGAAVVAHAHDEAEEGWSPANGVERTAYTVAADLLTSLGFALLLVAAYVLAGRPVDARAGMLWGLAAFATFTLAPGLGLPPEVPGTETAPLLARQLWWTGTVAATGGGLALIFLLHRPLSAAAGVVLLALPHLVGAPQPAEAHGAAPEGLAHAFAATVTVTNLLFWAVLGATTGHLFRRFGGTASPAVAVDQPHPSPA